jgi:urease accessory protein
VDSRGKLIVVKQRPEKIVSARVLGKNSDKIAQTAAIIGHTVGNMHRPISVSGAKIFFPIMAESEIELFKKLLPHGGVELKVQERVFQPDGATVGHEH